MRTEAASRGGKAKALPNRVGSWTTRPIETTKDLRLGLAEAFYQCTLGKISTAQLSALSQAAGVFARLLDPPRPGGEPDALRHRSRRSQGRRFNLSRLEANGTCLAINEDESPRVRSLFYPDILIIASIKSP